VTTRRGDRVRPAEETLDRIDVVSPRQEAVRSTDAGPYTLRALGSLPIFRRDRVAQLTGGDDSAGPPPT
jgi:hypothetical protein